MTTRLVTTRSLVDPYRAEVEDLIRYGFDRTPDIDDASIEIHVRLSNRSWTVHGTAYAKGIPTIANVAPGTTDLVTISIPHHRGRPDGRPNEGLFLYSKRAVPIIAADWREQLVFVAAHEAWHVHQGIRARTISSGWTGPKFSEVEADHWGRVVLETWRAEHGRLTIITEEVAP